MKLNLRVLLVLALAGVTGLSPAAAQSLQAPAGAEQVLASAASEQKYTFLVFYKDNGPATQAMAGVVQRGVESRSDKARFAFVNVADPAEKSLVDRFNVARAPMPLTIVLAPNGAMTSASPKTISDAQVAQAFVTPGAAHCMKAIQDGKLVFVCVQSTPKPVVPPAVQDFYDDPQFKGRGIAMFILASDPAEADFLRQLEVDATATAPTTVFLAPPGVLIGKFGPAATKHEMATALHKAGKCCDDPNCKLNDAGQQASQGQAARRK